MIAHPFIYEINTWPWLRRLGTQLGDVPGETWDAIADTGADAVWLMGVWQRSPAGTAIALADAPLVQTFRDTLPDYTADDVVGSPYCIRDYRVDDHLGGPEGLATARAALAARGIALILDFVPNHVAADHPWTQDHPEYFIGGTVDDLAADPESFIEVSGRVLANGRDPYFPAWRDVVQLNAFSADLRAEVARTLASIADQCDGVRCDMAMLMLNEIFYRTWGARAGEAPEVEYWASLIDGVHESYPDFTFIAEAYWDLEAVLQGQGFGYCYDKRLYDAFAAHSGPGAVRERLLADPGYQRGLVRFLENHDEPRAASVFGVAQQKAAAVATYTQLGAKLIYDGQLSGAVKRVPVQLGRLPDELVDDGIADFYRQLLNTLRDNVFRTGQWTLCDVTGWDGNATAGNLLAWTRSGDSRWLVVVNFSDQTATGNVHVRWEELRGKHFQLTDPTRDITYPRSGDDLYDGMYVDLDPWLWHLFRIEPTNSAAVEENP